MTMRSKAAYALAVLFAVNTMNFFDRQILGAVGEQVRREWMLSDGDLGWLGTAFTLLYAAIGVPLGRLTDRTVRTRILSAGVFIWSVLTAGSGLARNYAQLFAMRLGVGVGEATCAPAASSLIGDLFPASKRAKALSIFMMGLPVGVALSYFVSGRIAQVHGWRTAFYIAGLPGLICAIAALLMLEPKRGAAEVHDIGRLSREGPKGRSVFLISYVILGVASCAALYWLVSRVALDNRLALAAAVLFAVVYLYFRRKITEWLRPFLIVLSIPTMWWLIFSGALHNFNMYAIGSFLAPFLIRFHGTDLREAGDISTVVFGLSGIPGLLLGGFAGDAIMRRRANGRLLVATVSLFASVPFVFLALGRGRGETMGFMLLMSLGCAAMYVYYATVYSTIQDVIEPSLRGTAMALYFFAMYVLGASLGPVGTGLASDYFTQRAAQAAGVTSLTQQALEPFRADGLHSAMYLIPVLGVILTIVLFAGSRTVTKDMEKLSLWMRESVSRSAPGKAAAGA